MERQVFNFFTLYGHLNVASVLSYTPGDYIKKGQELSRIGGSEENGNWAPHLHFQVMLSLLNFKNDFPGVCFPNQEKIWSGICPDPNLLFKQTILNTDFNSIKEKIQADREVYLGKGMSLQYKIPIHIVRGEGVYLIDNKGRKFIDTVNNVAHVGHEHPKVVKAGQLQMGLLNTNTRYLHEHITTLAKRLVEKLPPELVVIHFVNSGSEANELAIRMVKTVTKSEEIIVSELDIMEIQTCVWILVLINLMEKVVLEHQKTFMFFHYLILLEENTEEKIQALYMLRKL